MQSWKVADFQEAPNAKNVEFFAARNTRSGTEGEGYTSLVSIHLNLTFNEQYLQAVPGHDFPAPEAGCQLLPSLTSFFNSGSEARKIRGCEQVSGAPPAHLLPKATTSGALMVGPVLPAGFRERKEETRVTNFSTSN